MMSNVTNSTATAWVRFRTPVAILVAYAAAQIMVWTWPALNSFQRFQAFAAVSCVAALSMAGWMLFNPRLRGLMKYLGMGMCGAAIMFVMKATRVDGYLGDTTPNVTWRWSKKSPEYPTAERNLAGTTAATSLDLRVGKFDSPGFLGPDRNGMIRGLRLSGDWTNSPPKQLWRRGVGAGWSSFAVAGNVAITQEQRGADEATVCYDLASGEECWVHLERNVKFSETYGGEGPRATPTISEGRVYSLGATGILNCLDGATGHPIWSTNILEDAHAKNLDWGMSGSPLVFDHTVVVNPGGKDGRSVVAYNANDGTIAWHAGSGQAAFSSPMHATIAGIEQVVLLNGPALESYNARSGEMLWSYPWVVNDSIMTSVTQPVLVDDHRLFISSGYGRGCALLDVSHASAGFSVAEIWPPNRNLKSKMSNVVTRDGFVYGLDEQILVCLNLATGERCWRAGRYGHGQVLLVDDTLLIQAESGDIALVKAAPERHQEIARFSPLSSKTWTAPAIAGNRLLVRNDREAACYELPVEQ